MAKLFQQYELLYSNEGSFKENAQSPASLTYASRVPCISMPSANLTQSRMSDRTVQSRKNQSRPGFAGLRGGTLSFTTLFPGLMTDPAAGALAENWCGDLLGDGLGGQLVADDGGTIGSATDADTFVTSGATLTAGNAICVGAKNDGRADGMMGVLSTWAGNNAQLLTALPATPNAADVVKICHALYPTEAEPTVTKRFLIGHTPTAAQWHAVGCQLQKFAIRLPVAEGDLPTIDWTYRVAYWVPEPTGVTIPSAVAMPNTETAIVAGGQFYAQTFGTATRAVRAISSLDITVDMDLIPDVGPAASQEPYGNVRGWVRSPMTVTWAYTRDWTAAAATDWDTDGASSTREHFLFQSNCTPARRIGIYSPRLYCHGDKPTIVNQGGLTFVREEWRAEESTDTASELTRSLIRFFQG